MGQSVHVPDKKNKEQVWAKGTVVGTEGASKINVKVDETGEMVSVDMKKTKALYTVNPKTDYDDMTSLYYLHEPGVSENLGARYVQDKIYTYVGRVLVVCNPFHRLTMPDPKDYTGKRLDANPPHNYAIADAAYSAFKASGCAESQSVIISGESGAGKTESSKIVMKYITTVANPVDGEEDLPERILGANPVLEAFGNGTTTRNWNSSRFGKFTQLEFEGANLCGASVQTYLLEKSRVVFQGAKERNVRRPVGPSLSAPTFTSGAVVCHSCCRCPSLSFTSFTTSSRIHRWTNRPGGCCRKSSTTTSIKAGRTVLPWLMTRAAKMAWMR